MSNEEKAVVKKAVDSLVIGGYRSDVLSRDSKGAIMAWKSIVPMTEGKHVHRVKMGGVEKDIIAADAYYLANRVAGLAIIEPPTVVVDGIERPNPYIERDPHSKTVSNVYVKRVVVGRGPSGKVSIVQVTTNFDVNTYCIQTLQKKSKTWGDKAGIKCVYAPADKQPDDFKQPLFFAVSEAFGMWVDASEQATRDALDDLVSKKKFADRIAATIAERTALRKHPCFGGGNLRYIKGTDNKAHPYLEVVGTVGRVEESDIAGWMKAVEAGQRVEDVDVTDSKHETADEDVQAALSDDDIEDAVYQDIENGKPSGPPATEAAAPAQQKPGTERANLIQEITTARLLIGDADYERVLKEHGIADFKGVPAEKLRACLEALHKEADKTQ